MELAAVLTVAGVATTAAIVTGFVELMKKSLPFIGERNLEQPLTLLVSLLIVALAFLSIGIFTLPTLFTAFVAWLSIAKLATGIHDEITGAEGSFRG